MSDEADILASSLIQGSGVQLYEMATIVIALCALGFTAWQAWVQRKHNIISVRPRLSIRQNLQFRDGGVSKISCHIENKGLGPAFIIEAQIAVDDKTCSVKEAVECILQGKDYQIIEMYQLGSKTAISSGESVTWFVVEVKAKTQAEALKLRDLLIKGTNLKIQYESAYGEKQEYERK